MSADGVPVAESTAPAPPSAELRKVMLVLLAWNSWPLTARTLDTLRGTDLAGATTIVIDNGSTDETARRLADYTTWVRVERVPENAGFVRGCNAGIALADPDSDIVLLNNDLIFEQADWLQRLRGSADAHPEAGIVGCRLLNEAGELVHTGTVIMPDTCWGQQSESGPEKDVGQYARDRPVQGVVFAVVYIKREVVDAIGGLDLAFMTYFEDTDYCLRARQAGFETLLCGGVTVVHTQHGSTREAGKLRDRLFKAGQAVFAARWKATLEEAYARAVLWQSTMNTPGRYSDSSRALMRGLDEAGVRVSYEYAGAGRSEAPLAEPEDSGVYLLNVIRARRVAEPPLLSIVHADADAFEVARGRVKVGYTIWAASRSAEERARRVAPMDEVWVPSAFDRDAFLADGVKRPIAVMPFGFDPDHFHPGIFAHRNPHGEYVFLASCGGTRRIGQGSSSQRSTARFVPTSQRD
jgi:GT2 family glycosyltransferase